MTDSPYYYPQEGQPHQRPAKKKHRFIKVMAILLVIAILSITLANSFLEPVLISRLTKGVLYGFHTTQVTENALENSEDLAKPTDKEIRDFSKYAKKLSNRINLSLNSEQKEHFKEIQNSAKLITEFIRKTEISENTHENVVATSNVKLKEDLKVPGSTKKPEQSLASLLYFDMASVALANSQNTLLGSESIGDEDEEDVVNVYDPEVLNDISVLLYTTGYPELASAVTAMAATEHPKNPRSALNFATVLREANADEDAFHVLQYALRLSPNSEPILYSLGMCALELGRTPYAEKCFMTMLSLNQSSGPAHQGMMLCYMDTGNYSSAFLHMLEGAREGYTSMVTETYKTLRQKNEEYMESIAKPIFEQYSMMQLVDFSKSRTPFDDTLDTPAGQLEISREINLGRNSANVYASYDALNEGLQYAMTAYNHGKSTFEDAYGMIQGLGSMGDDVEVNAGDITSDISKKILEKIFDSAASGSTVSSGGWLDISYEAEVFWLNILDDYVQIKLDDLLEEYFDKTYDEAFKDPDSVIPSLMQYNETLEQLTQNNPLQVGSMVLNNLINNNSVYDTGVQKADQQDLDKFLEKVSPRLEEGYKKTADLMEEYWTYNGGILGHIGNNDAYNRYQQARKTNVACALTPYVVAGTMNTFMVVMNYIAVDSDNIGGGGEVRLPNFPDFPGSQMGQRYEPPAPPQPPSGSSQQGGEPSQQEGTTGQQEENPDSGDNSSQTGESGPGETGEPGTAEPSQPGGPGTAGPITTENSFTVSIGPFSASYHAEAGFEVDLTLVGSTNVRYNRKTGDLSLFGGIGGSLGAATSGVSARTGVYTTVNLETWGITSGTRSTLEGQLAGNGMGVERVTCFATGADKTTVSAILLHKKSSQTIDNN
ncbi:MAG: hypothetical protein GX115_16860 [Ruminiclostridium sp.]|nr:hypothetical protein [Ruminiclostridium sp.]